MSVMEALVKQTAFINILHKEISSKLFYSLSMVFFLTNSLDKVSVLLFIFIGLCKEYCSLST